MPSAYTRILLITKIVVNHCWNMRTVDIKFIHYMLAEINTRTINIRETKTKTWRLEEMVCLPGNCAFSTRSNVPYSAWYYLGAVPSSTCFTCELCLVLPAITWELCLVRLVLWLFWCRNQCNLSPTKNLSFHRLFSDIYR